MAKAGYSVDYNDLNCNFCRNLLKDPMTIGCGHSCCMDCITKCSATIGKKTVYYCPKCNYQFDLKKDVCVNWKLREVVSELASSEPIAVVKASSVRKHKNSREDSSFTQFPSMFGASLNIDPEDETFTPRTNQSQLSRRSNAGNNWTHSKMPVSSSELFVQQKIQDNTAESGPQPQTYKELLKYSLYLTVDEETAHKNIAVIDDKRGVLYPTNNIIPSLNPERFDHWKQVLCKEPMTKRSFFEVIKEGKECVYISVTYKSISRIGGSNECRFGRNPKSWCLRCSSTSVAFLHNGDETEISGPSPNKIGVYLDPSAGILGFFSCDISNSPRLLHSVHDSFNEPVYAGFGFYSPNNKLPAYQSTIMLTDSE